MEYWQACIDPRDRACHSVATDADLLRHYRKMSEQGVIASYAQVRTVEVDRV